MTRRIASVEIGYLERDYNLEATSRSRFHANHLDLCIRVMHETDCEPSEILRR
jgi:hypothetical protein